MQIPFSTLKKNVYLFSNFQNVAPCGKYNPAASVCKRAQVVDYDNTDCTTIGVYRRAIDVHRWLITKTIHIDSICSRVFVVHFYALLCRRRLFLPCFCLAKRKSSTNKLTHSLN